MKCPHCGYEHGWSAELLKSVNGEHGEFYKSPVEMVQEDLYNTYRCGVYGCPACKKLFLGD